MYWIGSCKSEAYSGLGYHSAREYAWQFSINNFAPAKVKCVMAGCSRIKIGIVYVNVGITGFQVGTAIQFKGKIVVCIIARKKINTRSIKRKNIRIVLVLPFFKGAALDKVRSTPFLYNRVAGVYGASR